MTIAMRLEALNPKWLEARIYRASGPLVKPRMVNLENPDPCDAACQCDQ